MMGSGKTMTGKALAAQLGYAFVDLDAEIQTKEGCSIAEIFAQKGEPYFREVESSVLKDFSKKARQVIATGGGIALREANVQLIRETGTPCLLQASAKSLWERVRYSKDRPLLNKPNPYEALKQILKDRKNSYEKACFFSVQTDGKTAEDVASEIQEKIRLKT